MGKESRKVRQVQDGVRVIEEPRRPVAAVLVVVTLLVAVFVWFVSDGEESPEAVPLAVESVGRRPVVPARADRLREQRIGSATDRAREVRRAAIPERRAHAEPASSESDAESDVGVGTELDEGGSFDDLAKDLIERFGSSGRGGLAVFPPPGTNPVKTGIVVPDEFELPEGYVRYHQTTDDGKRLEPILMFSPDYVFTDPDGNPIPVEEDGIVPPEMAPPGLPVRMLEIPGAAAKDPPG